MPHVVLATAAVIAFMLPALFAISRVKSTFELAAGPSWLQQGAAVATVHIPAAMLLAAWTYSRGRSFAARVITLAAGWSVALLAVLVVLLP